jgi:RimJ/RimL family protein N-acetyltransferase
MVSFSEKDLPIHTDRLTLRAYRQDDAESVFELYSNPDVVRYLYSEVMQPERLAESMDRRLQSTRLEVEGDMLELAAELRDGGQFVGAMTFFYRSTVHQRGELGYIILPQYAGRGFATEGARALLAIGFDQMGLHRIEAQCDARNVASARVMERIGMRREGHMRENEFVKGEWTDEVLCAMLHEEWTQIKGS